MRQRRGASLLDAHSDPSPTTTTTSPAPRQPRRDRYPDREYTGGLGRRTRPTTRLTGPRRRSELVYTSTTSPCCPATARSQVNFSTDKACNEEERALGNPRHIDRVAPTTTATSRGLRQHKTSRSRLTRERHRRLGRSPPDKTYSLPTLCAEAPSVLQSAPSPCSQRRPDHPVLLDRQRPQRESAHSVNRHRSTISAPYDHRRRPVAYVTTTSGHAEAPATRRPAWTNLLHDRRVNPDDLQLV